MKNINHNNSNNQNGFSLVEILVAMVLSAVLVTGVIQMYLSSNESYKLQSEMARMQENQRLALAFLQRDIRMAGYFEGFNKPNYNHIPKFDDSEVGGVKMTRNGASAADSDVITVRYEATEDCLGQAVTTVAADGNIYAVNQYSISNGQLMCLGNGDDVVGAQPLVSGIENMQILYGENTSGLTPGAAAAANRYVRPETANLNQVVSVRISLLFASEKNVREKSASTEYYLLDSGKLSFNDKKRRQVVTTTIQLRNNT